MNNHPWLWISFGCALTVVVLLVIRYLLRLRSPYPEDVFMLSRPLDQELVSATFDLHNATSETTGRPKNVSLKLILARLTKSYEYFTRMRYNMLLIISCGKRDQLAATSMERAQREAVLDAQAMLTAAESCEADARLPEYEKESSELLTRAAALRNDAQAQLSLAQKLQAENDTMRARRDDVLLSARQVYNAARIQLLKIMLLIVLLRMDKFACVPPQFIVRLWHKGSLELLRLYEDTRHKAGIYLLETELQLLTDM